MTARPRLPNELWLEIIKSIPQSHVTARKLLSVSRTLYALARPIAHRILVVTEGNLLGILALFADTCTFDLDQRNFETAAQRVCQHTEVLFIRTIRWYPTADDLRLFTQLTSIQSHPVPLLAILTKARRHALLPLLTDLYFLGPSYPESLPPTIKRVSIRYRMGPINGALNDLVSLTWPRRPGSIESIGLQIYDRQTTGQPDVVGDTDLSVLLRQLHDNTMGLCFVLHTRGRAAEDETWRRYVKVINDQDDDTRRRVRVWRDTRHALVYRDRPMTDSFDHSDLDIDEDLDIEYVEADIDMWSQAKPVQDLTAG